MAGGGVGSPEWFLSQLDHSGPQEPLLLGVSRGKYQDQYSDRSRAWSSSGSYGADGRAPR